MVKVTVESNPTITLVMDGETAKAVLYALSPHSLRDYSYSFEGQDVERAVELAIEVENALDAEIDALGL